VAHKPFRLQDLSETERQQTFQEITYIGTLRTFQKYFEHFNEPFLRFFSNYLAFDWSWRFSVSSTV